MNKTKREPSSKQRMKKKPNKKTIYHEPTKKEIGGPVGPEPTRFGDWEKNGRCSDF
jgi:hypothetical protein